MAAHEKLRIFLRLCKIIDFFVFWGENVGNEQPFDNLIHDNLGELMLSQRSDLLKQSLDFYESDVLPATQPIVSKHYMKVQWFGRLLIHRHGISTPCLTNSVKTLYIPRAQTYIQYKTQ